MSEFGVKLTQDRPLGLEWRKFHLQSFSATLSLTEIGLTVLFGVSSWGSGFKSRPQNSQNSDFSFVNLPAMSFLGIGCLFFSKFQPDLCLFGISLFHFTFELRPEKSLRQSFFDSKVNFSHAGIFLISAGIVSSALGVSSLKLNNFWHHGNNWQDGSSDFIVVGLQTECLQYNIYT
jgi:hypothetical protein